VRYGSTDPIQQLIETAEQHQAQAVIDFREGGSASSTYAHAVVRHIVRMEKHKNAAMRLYRAVGMLDQQLSTEVADFAEERYPHI
jgi:hypothetical protein